jgi:glycerol-3-phosphate cytidylyltransferase
MKYGFICSTFDLCHAGHLRMLKDAKDQCDYLIVGLQDNPATSSDLKYRLETGGKEKNAPIMSLEERMEIMKAIKYVDEVITYTDEADLYRLIQRLANEGRYHVRIQGSDWEGKKYTGWDLTKQAYFHKRNHSYSTSELRSRVYHAERERLHELSQEKPIEQQSFGKRFAYGFQHLLGLGKQATKKATERATATAHLDQGLNLVNKA